MFYNSAPLPFFGQKRAFLKLFYECLRHFSPHATYLDLFGGSALLSHNLKQFYPEARVIYNDHDNFMGRIENLKKTNAIIDELREYGVQRGIKYAQRLEKEERAEVYAIFQAHEERGELIDYATLGASLLFSARRVNNLKELMGGSIYWRIPKKNYPQPHDYLEGVERVSGDFRAVYEAHKDARELVLVCDPPYLSTLQNAYGKEWFRVEDFLNLMDIVERHPFIFFSSERSEFYALVKYLTRKKINGGSLLNITPYAQRRGALTARAHYVDNLYYSPGVVSGALNAL